MRISLISPYPDITAFGMRTLSSYLKQHGHKTQLIFLPDPFGDDIKYGVERYEDEVLDAVASLCSESHLIGITLMTNFFAGAVQLTNKLKSKLDVPILWGGVHPTIRPEESLEFADMVCIGEGEDALLELANKLSSGEDYSCSPNLWVKSRDRIIKNPLKPLSRDLDVYPPPDYSLDDHHVLLGRHLLPFTHEIMKSLLGSGTVARHLGRIGYQTMTSRGCPHRCAYCINDTIRRIYGGKYKLRWRSVPHIMAELAWVKKNLPYVNYIWISDDEFMARKLSELKEFCREYKLRIGLPFSCLLSPLTVTEEKMELLVDAGLIYVQMGAESGSARMQEVFNRTRMNNKTMLKAMHVINRYKDVMHPPSYDFLLDVPGETNRDKIDSLKFIAEIPKPYRLQPFTLIPYPGTRIFQMAKERGFLVDEAREIYNKTYTMREPTYLNLLITLAKGGQFPAWLLKLLVSTPLVEIMCSKPMKPFFKLVYMVMKTVHHATKSFVNKLRGAS